MTAQKLRLLLVEDDDKDRNTVHRLLDSNYMVVDAPTRLKALKFIKVIQPDGILLGCPLSNYERWQLLSYLVGDGLPVVILTREESPEMIIKAMQLGAQDYLLKDNVSSISLDQAIINAIEKVALKRNLEEKQRKLIELAATLEEQNKKIRILASELTLAEQRERRRISQMLHDDLQQTIYGIQIRKHLLNMSLPSNLQFELREHMEALSNLISRAIDYTRLLTVQLNPPILKGRELNSTFEWLATQMAEIHQLKVDIEIRANHQIASEDLHILIFQFVRELLFNVVKHAGVQLARLEIDERDNQLFISVRDKGVGFDPALPKRWTRGGFGLASIQERLSLIGGALQIDSAPGQGTCATIIVANFPS